MIFENIGFGASRESCSGQLSHHMHNNKPITFLK